MFEVPVGRQKVVGFFRIAVNGVASSVNVAARRIQFGNQNLFFFLFEGYQQQPRDRYACIGVDFFQFFLFADYAVIFISVKNGVVGTFRHYAAALKDYAG